jgi:WD40 repeat protein
MKIINMGCEDGTLRLFPLTSNRMIQKIYIGSSVSCLELMANWQVVCGTHNGSISVWDLRKYAKILEFEKCHQTKYDEGVLCVWADCNKIVSGGADGSIKIFS